MRISVRTLAAFLALASAHPSIRLAAQMQTQMQMPACHAMPNHADPKPPSALPPPEHLTGIGNGHFPISSKNPETQQWFDQGINLTYDFWDYEAARAFEQAVRTDPDCAICHWALYETIASHGKDELGTAHDELQKAVALESKADPREKLYIAAAQEEEKQSLAGSEDSSATQAILRKIVKKYPTDTVARLMLSESVGDGYDKDGKPRKGTQEKIAILQEILKQNPNDSAANHLWIHAVEASPHPEQALHSAEILASLAPNSGHMTHMPGHIFYRTGDYARAQQSFDLSESVDEAYMRAQKVSVDDDWNYVHNLMYSIANLMEEGRMQQATIVSARLTSARGDQAATLYPWSTRDSIARINTQLPIALRTGDWPRVESMLAASHPSDTTPNLEFLAGVLTNFAKGMQAVQDHNTEQASANSFALDADLWRFSQQNHTPAESKDPKPPAQPVNQPISPNPAPEPLLKNVAILSLELRAAILVENKKIPEAQKLLDQARQQEQDLGYHEPPAFIRPVAEQQAEIMMAAGDSKAATEAWKQALKDRPNSGFPLYGMAQIAEKEGDTQRATAEYQEFLNAWKTADPDLPEVAHAKQWLGTKDTQSASAARP
jgi:tetratricopeptide (TPR) repeat protein